MRKTEYITMQQCDNDDELFIVDRLVNCTEPNVGLVMKRSEVARLNARHNVQVTVKRAKG